MSHYRCIYCSVLSQEHTASPAQCRTQACSSCPFSTGLDEKPRRAQGKYEVKLLRIARAPTLSCSQRATDDAFPIYHKSRFSFPRLMIQFGVARRPCLAKRCHIVLCRAMPTPCLCLCSCTCPCPCSRPRLACRNQSRCDAWCQIRCQPMGACPLGMSSQGLDEKSGPVSCVVKSCGEPNIITCAKISGWPRTRRRHSSTRVHLWPALW